MRDPVLDRHPAFLAAQGRTRDARIRVEGMAEASMVVSELVRWCRDVLFQIPLMSTDADGGALSDLLTLPPEELPLRALQCISDVAEREAVENGLMAVLEGRSDDQRDAAAWLFGEATAKALDHQPASEDKQTEQFLRRIWDLVRSDSVVLQAFTDSLRVRLKEYPSVRTKMLSALPVRIDEINNNPAIGVFAREREGFNESIVTWRKNPSPDLLWAEQSRWIHVHYDVLEIVPHILPAARNEILKYLDGFNFPHPIAQVLSSALILHDRDEIAELLRASPMCSDDGRTWNGRLMALLVLRTAEDHCDALWREVRSRETSEDADARALEIAEATLLPWLEKLATILMARRDAGIPWSTVAIAESLRRASRPCT